MVKLLANHCNNVIGVMNQILLQCISLSYTSLSYKNNYRMSYEIDCLQNQLSAEMS
jgi:hypothetical protein